MKFKSENNIYLEICRKASENVDFKKQLLEDPIVAIESIIDKKINGNIKIEVCDQSDESIIYFNIPREPSLDNIELTQEQLELVAGGKSLPTVTLALTGSLCLAGYAGYKLQQYLDS